MQYSATDKKRVYLACRAIFTGNNARLRRQKKIKELVERHKPTLTPLIRDFGVQKVVDILRVLLETKIFASELKAKLEFPELFRSSPDRDNQRAESEQIAARSIEGVIEEIASAAEPEAAEPSFSDNDDVVMHMSPMEKQNEPINNLYSSPSLYQSYFPYQAQHLILTTVQRILEECCFDFVKKWFPSLISDYEWECAESVELTQWTRLLVKRSGKIPAHAFAINTFSLNDVLLSTHRIRHTAVHRVRTTTHGISKLVEIAVNCAATLQDTVRSLQLEELLKEIDSKITAMDLNKNVLEDTVSQELEKIRQQREELDRFQKRLIEDMKSEDLKHKSLIGSLLEEYIRKGFTETEGAVEADEDNSEAREDDGRFGDEDISGVAL